ncbi:hypothetical protein KAU08_08740, partial [bacterium]|nr:hypothetical protein [bacterium]
YIMKDPQAFQLQFGANLIGRIHDSFSVTTQFVREITDRYLYAYGITSAGSVTGRLKILILAGYITGVIGYVISVRVTGLKKEGILPWMLLLFFLTFAILFNQKQPRYLIYILPFYTMILGTWICSAWGSSAKARIGLVILLAIMAIGQLGINIRRMANDDYHRIYEPVIEVLTDKIDGSTLVMGMPEIAFEFGYTPNILDDYTFGYFSGKEADIAIIDSEYRLLHSIIKEHEPEIYEDIQYRIETEFEEIYSNEQVTIYVRTPPS